MRLGGNPGRLRNRPRQRQSRQCRRYGTAGFRLPFHPTADGETGWKTAEVIYVVPTKLRFAPELPRARGPKRLILQLFGRWIILICDGCPPGSSLTGRSRPGRARFPIPSRPPAVGPGEKGIGSMNALTFKRVTAGAFETRGNTP
jgi:hypothetical protein